MKLAVLVLVVAGLIGSWAAPRRQAGSSQERTSTESDICATSCSGANNKFQYEEGKTYKYKWTTSTEIQNQENSIEATVLISPLGDCDYTLKLKNIRADGEIESADLERPLRFSFDDGLIREVCPTEQHASWAVNVQRGILSTLQNSLEGSSEREKTVDEEDISGKCPTDYTNQRNSFTKSKDLSRCQNHRGLDSALRGVSYDLRTAMQNSALVQSQQECSQSFQNNILKKATCTETHSFNPLQRQRLAIEAKTQSQLEFQNKKAGTEQSQMGERQSLNFDHSQFDREDESVAAGQAQANMQQLCQTSNNNVRSQTPGLFTEFVYSLRKMSYSDIKTQYEEAKQNGVCSQQLKFFLDAVPMCASENCVKLMTLIIKERSLSDAETNAWYMSLSLVPRPSKAMIKAVTPLLSSATSASAYGPARLGVSSLVNGYCRQNPACGEVSEVKEVVDKLAEDIRGACTKQQNQDKLIVSLKAIGNIGNVRSVMPKLVKCFEKTENPIEIRLAAIQALRRRPCGGQQEEALMTLFKSQEVNVELRLNAFLGLMKCPRGADVSEIHQLLESEPVNQVTSFVWSFLKAKKNTNDPCQSKFNNLLRGIRLGHKYNRDPRRYSRFYEVGSFNPRRNYGGHAEAAWIFTPESYIPKQGFMNLTLHLFGQSFNLLEIGGRADGLDNLINKFYGPDGYFTDPESYLMKSPAKAHSNKKIQKFEDLYKKSFPVSDRDEVTMSMYMKIFGDEIAFQRYQGSGLENGITDSMDLEQLLQKLRDAKDISLSKNLLFLNSALTIPTSAGIPLRLAVNGTASIRMEFKSSFDMANFLRPNMRVKMTGTLSPSAAVEIASSMGFQLNNQKSGVKMVSRVHTSSSMKGLLEANQGKFNTKFELPQEKMEIIDVRSNVFTVKNNVETEISQQGPQSKGKTCTPESLGKLVGLKLCSEVQTPRRLVGLFNGPMHANIVLEKADPTLMSYVVDIETSQDQGKSTGKFEFNTPGSTVDRRIVFDYEHQPMSRITAQLQTPGKHLAFTGTLSNQGAKQTGRLSLTVDRTNTYAVSTTVETKGSPQTGVEYEMTGEAVRPDAQPIKMTGSMAVPGESSSRQALEFQVENLYSTPVEGKLVWDISRQQNAKINLEAHWQCPALNFDVTYAGGMDKGGYNYKLMASYKTPSDAAPHKLTMSQTQKSKQTGARYELTSNSNFDISSFPDWKSEMSYTLIKDSDILENRLTVTYAGQQKKVFKIHQVTRKNAANGRHVTDLTGECQDLGLDHKMKMEYLNNMPQKYYTSIKLDTPRLKNINMLVRMENENKPKWNLEGEAKLSWKNQEMRLFKSVKQIRKNEYKTNGILQWAPGKQIELDTNLKTQNKRNQIHYEIEAEGKMSGQSNSLKLIKKFKQTPSETKFVGSLKSGNQEIYDTKFELTKASQNKWDLKTHMKSSYSPRNQLDMALTGSMEKHQRTSKMSFNLQNQRQDYAKGEFIVPTHPEGPGDQKILAQLIWDVQSPKPKEVKASYKLTSEGNDRLHEFKSKFIFNRHNYLTHLQIEKKSTEYSLNLTSKNNGQEMLEASVGFRHPDAPYSMGWLQDGFSFDSRLKSSAPLARRDLVAEFSIENAQKTKHGQQLSGIEAKAIAKCSVSGNKAGFNLALLSAGRPGSVDRSFKIYANEMSLESDANVIMSNSDFKSTSQSSVTWAPTKTIRTTSEFEFVMGQPGVQHSGFKNYKWALFTPFEALSQAEFSAERKNDLSERKSVHEIEVSWNNNNRINEEITFESQPGGKMVYNSKLTSTFASLKSMNTDLELDFANGAKFDVSTEWNTANKLQLYYTPESSSSKTQLNTGFVAKVEGQADMEGKFEGKSENQKIDLDVSFRSSNQKWQVDADLDKTAKTGSVEISTPSQTYSNVKITVEQNGDDWVFKTDRNGQAEVEVTANVKYQPMSKVLSITVDKIAQPFNFALESTQAPRKSIIKAELTLNPNEADKVVYGGRVESSQSGNKGTNLIKLSHPSREMWAKMTDDASPQGQKYTFQLQTNGQSGRAPTQIELENSRQGLTQLTISDPSLENDVVVAFQLGQRGNSGELTVDYAGGVENKILKISATSERVQGGHSFELKVEHPATNLLYKIWAKQSRNNNKVGVEAGVQFKTPQREVKQFSINGGWDERKNLLNAKISTPSSTYGFETKNKGKKCVIVLLADAKPQAEIQIGYDSKTFGMVYPNQIEIIKLKARREVLVHLSAKLLSKSHFRLRFWHSERKQQIQDAEISIKLSQSDLLTTRFFLRPGLNREISHVLRQGLSQGMGRSAPSGNVQDLYHSARSSRLSQEIQSSFRPLMNHYQNEKNTMAQEMGPAYAEVAEKVELGLVMIREFLLASLDVIDMSLAEVLNASPSETLSRAYDSVISGASAIPESVGQMLEPLRGSVDAMSRGASQFGAAIGSVAEAIREKTNWNEIQRSLAQMAEDAKDYPIIREILEWLAGIRDTVSQMDMESAKQTVKSYYNKAEKQVKAAGQQANSAWQEWKETVMDYELGRALVGYLKESYGKMSYLYNEVNPRGQIDNAFESLKSYMTGGLNGKSFKDMMPRFESNPEEGIYIMKMPLPADVNSLGELVNNIDPALLYDLKDQASDSLQSLSEQMGQYQIPEIPKSAYDESPHGHILDYIESYRPNIMNGNALPPFNSRAILVGNQHFVTFDGKTFDFKAKCDYLLAKDFHDNKFSIVGKFGGNSKVVLEALEVHTNDQVIELQRNGNVKIGGRQHELPWQKMDAMSGQVSASVIRRDHSIQLKTSDGIKIRCDLYYHSCSIKIAGHFHGKSRGLLGTNDNEHSNDFTLPNGQQTSDVQQFAESWITNSCSNKRNVATKYSRQQHNNAVCSELFKDGSSSFKPCFQSISPVPFYKMCNVYVSEMGSERRASCNITSAYITMCRGEGIRLNQPSTCIECDVYSKGSIEEGQEETVESSSSPNTADVVFVVDEGKESFKKQNLIKLAQKIESELKKQNRRNVRFGIVGFNGQGIHYKPHYHTGGLEILFAKSELNKAVDNFSFKRNSFVQQEERDPMEAMNWVSKNFPFRSATEKIAILVADSSNCQGNQVGYYDLQENLLNGGITFHLLSTQSLELEGEASSSVVGFDASKMFLNNGQSNTELRSKLQSPHDSCTALAQETNGVVIPSGPGAKTNAIVKVLSQQVAAKVPASRCQICECQLACRWSNTPRTFCYPCEVPRPVSLTNGGNSYFNIPYLSLSKPKA